jgi:hypothetical protein
LSSKKPKRKEDIVQQFRRLIHQWRLPRRSLATARRKTDAQHFPKVVSTLGQQQIYKGLFAISPFPSRLDQVARHPRLAPLDGDGEFIWSACVMALFAAKISDFLKLKQDFFHFFTNAHYSEAENVLDTIEQNFGFSLWLIQYRIQLLQIYKGLQSQKDYVEEILSTEGLSPFTAWLTYFFSLRSEENMSFSKLQEELDTVISRPLVGDYVLNHILPYDLTQVTDPRWAVHFEEANPIIDRYETLVSMLQVKICRERDRPNENNQVVLNQLKSVDDVRLRRLEALTAASTNAPNDSVIIRSSEAYTRGDYDTLDDSGVEALELIARARAITDSPSEDRGERSLREQIINAMQGILTLSSNAQQHRLHLKKLALTFPKHDYAIQIASFLDRKHDFVLNAHYSELDYFAAINSALENPWHSALISNFAGRSDWLLRLSEKYPGSVALRLRQALNENPSSEIMSELEEKLPQHRFNTYRGHIEFAKGEIKAAVHAYTLATMHSSVFVSAHAKRYLFDAYYAAGDYKQCLSLVVTHVLSHPTAVSAYKISELAKVCLEGATLNSDINLAILLHLNVVHVHHRWERELSDIFENVLSTAGMEKPSELIGRPGLFELPQEIYFLRYICTPRILGDTTCFESVDEIEEERIAICQYLLSLDPDAKEEYLSEIRGITRDINVAHLLKKVQSSKIYVDEAGLRQSFETTLLDTFIRYQRLLDSPVLAYQAEKLSKLLEDMLKGNADVKDFKLPASEREALFETLLNDFMVEFAFNPAYGLDTHVSTTIRHGAFEGHIRSPFAAEDLLCKKREKEFLLPRAWNSKLEHFTPEDFAQVRRQLGRFTAKIEELISLYLSQKIRVREDGNTGMFIFVTNKAAKAELRESITEATDYHSFLDKFFAHGWELVDESMTLIRQDLYAVLLHQVNIACDSLVLNLEQTLGHEKITPLVDAVVRAQTAFQSAVADVAEWFRRPQDLSRDPFDFEVAVRVALQQIHNCYVKTPLEPELNLNVRARIDGKFVDGICEIFYILLQNVILHSGFSDQTIPVNVSADRTGDTLVVSCKNEIAPEVDIQARRYLAQEAMGKYQRDTAMKLARKEGGSGLSKIWRIAEFDLRLKHQIDICVADDRTFTTKVTLSGIKVVSNADVHS